MRLGTHASSMIALLAMGCGARSGLEVPAPAPDAGPVIDAAPCVPRGVEQCGPIDDDCDGRIDEGLPIGPIAEAFALRTTELETLSASSCDTCQWAWRPSLVPTREGFFVPFHLGIYGGRESPSLAARSTDADGRPVGEVTFVGDSVPLYLRHVRGEVSTGASWIEATLRIGTDDLAGYVVVDPDGSVRVVNLGAGRRAHAQSTIAMRDGVLTAWHQDADPERIDAARVDASGRVLAVSSVSGDLFPTATLTSHTLARRVDGEGAVLFVARFISEPRTFDLHAIRLDADGRAIEAPRTLDPALPQGLPQLRAMETDEGYVVFDPGNGTPTSARFVSASLDAIEAPIALDTEDGSDLGFTVMRIAGGLLVIAGNTIVRLDARGRPIAHWRGRLAPGTDEGNAYTVTPDLAVRDGRTFVTWHGIERPGVPNTVWIRELGCLE